MRKNIKCFIFGLALIFSLLVPTNNVNAQQDIKLWINGDYVKSDVSPIIENDRTLVPIRVISEALGEQIEWRPDSKQILLQKDELVISFQIDKAFYGLGDMERPLDVAPKIINNRTMVPIRSIAEIFGNEVSWDQDNRTVVIGDGYIAPKPIKSKNTFTEAKVTRVVDGDTIKASINGEEYTIRFILVDTPETVHPSKPVEFFGKEASEYTKKNLEGKTVYLQKDVSDFDRYGRMLSYVWLTRPSTNEPTKEEIIQNMFNAKLIANGYANLSTFPPDVKYVDLFRELETTARNNNWGLWNKPVPVTNNQVPATPNTNINNQGNRNPVVYDNNPIAGGYIGNANSKIFHKSSCASVRRMKPSNQVSLTKDEAISRGYRGCKKCNP